MVLTLEFSLKQHERLPMDDIRELEDIELAFLFALATAAHAALALFQAFPELETITHVDIDLLPINSSPTISELFFGTYNNPDLLLNTRNLERMGFTSFPGQLTPTEYEELKKYHITEMMTAVFLDEPRLKIMVTTENPSHQTFLGSQDREDMAQKVETKVTAAMTKPPEDIRDLVTTKVTPYTVP